MPDPSQGYTSAEIVTRVTNYIGNASSSFQTYLEQTVPLAIFRFCKMHDWSFLRKTGLTLNTVTGQAEYDLSAANMGFLMASTDVEIIRAEEASTVLRRLDLNQLRRYDPGNDDGSSNDTPVYWAPAGDNKIRIWPPTVKVTALKIDGKITPTVPDPANSGDMAEFISVLSGIPHKYQESLIEYIVALALDRENDDRAAGKKQEALALIREDIKADLASLSDVENPRIKSLLEARFDGLSASLNIPGFGPGE